MRYYTSGNSRPHIVHHGYQCEPRVKGPLVRPEGEPGLIVGTSVVVGVFVLLALVGVVLG